MSYTLSIPPTPRPEVVNAVVDQVKRLMVEQIEPATDAPVAEVRDHLTAVTAAVVVLAGALGADVDDLIVNVTGHANPGHAPKPGWSDELIHISVAVARPAVAPAA